MAKTIIRQDILRRRRQLEAGIRNHWSGLIQAAVLATPEFAAARTVALYSPIHNEVGTEELALAAWSAGKVVAFPRVGPDGLDFVPVTSPGGLRPGRFGIPEPKAGSPLPLSTIDLMTVPGVTFDLSGHRLGYGKGFYDRVFHCERGTVFLVGLAFDFQVVSELPTESHDVRLNLVVTEKRTLRFADHGAEGIIHHPSQGGPRR